MATVRPLKPCQRPGCGKYSNDGSCYCAEHKRMMQAKRDAVHRKSKGGVYNSRWARASKAFLAEHPVCAVCGAPATEVDHIIPHKKDMDLFWDSNNWQALCHSCHSKKTMNEGSFGRRVGGVTENPCLV